MVFNTTPTFISTSVCIVDLFCEIDIENLYKHIELNDIYLAVKWNNNYRGVKYEKNKTGCFFNQTTIIMYVEQLKKEVNLKVFNTGKCQISGIKNIEHSKIVINIFLKTIANMIGNNNIQLLLDDHIFFNKLEYDNFNNKLRKRFNSIKFYNVEKKIVIGEKKGSDFYINIQNKNYIERIQVINYHRDPTLFLEKDIIKDETDLKSVKKRIFDKKTGENVGYIIFTFSYKRKNIDYIKYSFKITQDPNTFIILDKKKYEIGIEKVIMKSNESNVSNKTNTINEIVIPYKVLFNFKNKPPLYILKNINANFQLTFSNKKNFLLEREKLNNIFIEEYNLNSSCILDGKYPAIQVIFYYDKDLNLIEYKFKEFVKLKEYQNSISIFANGNVLIFASKSVKQIETVKRDLLAILNEIYIYSGNSIFKKEKKEIEIKDINLSIWDFL
jgi:TATA-box binding protein (TBP) (component of TFIID and TFIIIB)